jgi:hypothetical protein
MCAPKLSCRRRKQDYCVQMVKRSVLKRVKLQNSSWSQSLWGSKLFIPHQEAMSLTGHSPQEVDGVPLPMPAHLRLCCSKPLVMTNVIHLPVFRVRIDIKSEEVPNIFEGRYGVYSKE